MAEPGSVYLGIIPPKTGKSSDISNNNTDKLAENKHMLYKFSALGCDGIEVCTGSKVIKICENRHLLCL